MKLKKDKFLTGKHTYLAIIAMLFVTCTLVSFACFRYYIKLQETVKAESGNYLQEISKQISTSVSKNMEDNFTILNTVVTALQNQDISTFNQLYSVIWDQQQRLAFDHLLIVDENGISYDAKGHTVVLHSDTYLREAIIERKQSMSTSQMMDGTECIVFAVPLEGISVTGIHMSALVATHSLTTFDQLLSMTAFEGKGYGYIMRRDGAVVIRSSSPYAPQIGYNILSALSEVPFVGKPTSKTVFSDIENGKMGQAEVILDEEPLYMSYIPLETKEWYLLSFVPVAVANAKSILLFRITLLMCALITLLFCILMAIIIFTNYRHKRKLEQLAFVDPVTGGNTIQRFNTEARELLLAPGAPQYVIVYFNITKFKLLNEQLGRASCDIILRTAFQSIQANLDTKECMGRLFADNFCILLRYQGKEELVSRFRMWSNRYEAALRETDVLRLPLSVELGMYVVEDATLLLPDMLDRAKIALRESPQELDAQLRYAIYDEKIRHHMLREKQLEDRQALALEQNEFQVYLQPKYDIDRECIGGAEALARWQSPAEGMIYPDEFISLFEKNGFVIQLDLWVFEQVCKTLRSWLDKGYAPMRISVNCSRIHLKTPGFLNQYDSIIQRYQIPPALLEIELTENVVFEDVRHLTQTIAEIHALGLHCSMDDFGSGYSSLNLIQNIPVDVLKLDKIFFNSESNNMTRTESVVGSIITMAHALSMETVAEGVEERSQVDMLKRLGCDYIQGYYFAKPMPIADFESKAFE